MDIETENEIRKSVRNFIDTVTYEFVKGKSRKDLMDWFYITTPEMIVYKFGYGSEVVNTIVNDEWREYE